MPKLGAMAQISRPFQIALLAVVLLGGVWLFALRGKPQTSQPATVVTHVVTPAAKAPASASAPTAPGVSGLSRVIAKAHGAVSTSQQNAKQLEEKSARASSETSAAASGAAASGGTASASAPHVNKTVAPKKASHVVATPVAKTPVAPVSKAPSKASVLGKPAHQQAVEAELNAGDVVVLLFWDRKGFDDVAVQRAVSTLASARAKVAVHVAVAGEVASFGSITRGVQVFQTPTVLIVGKRGQTAVITGLTDTYSLQQAIADARSTQTHSS
jgi:hypothetical protein